MHGFLAVHEKDVARAWGYTIPEKVGKSIGNLGTITVEDGRIVHNGVQLSGTAQAHIKTSCQGRLDIYHRSNI